MMINSESLKIGAIIQARTGSTRLPNKIFSTVSGHPLLWHVWKRITYTKLINTIIIATTNKKEDDIVERWANENKILIYRGSEKDVLSRYYNAALEHGLDIIVRITSDDPFKDPILIDEAIRVLIDNNLNFVYNNKPPSFPEGLDVEIFDFKSLEIANTNSSSPFEREHVTQFFFNNIDNFRHFNITSKENYSSLRWTIDEDRDLEMATIVYENLYTENKIFLYQDILNLIKKKPHIATINSNIERSEMYKNFKNEKI